MQQEEHLIVVDDLKVVIANCLNILSLNLKICFEAEVAFGFAFSQDSFEPGLLGLLGRRNETIFGS